jgi:hypothetical protein
MAEGKNGQVVLKKGLTWEVKKVSNDNRVHPLPGGADLRI